MDWVVALQQLIDLINEVATQACKKLSKLIKSQLSLAKEIKGLRNQDLLANGCGGGSTIASFFKYGKEKKEPSDRKIAAEYFNKISSITEVPLEYVQNTKPAIIAQHSFTEFVLLKLTATDIVGLGNLFRTMQVDITNGITIEKKKVKTIIYPERLIRSAFLDNKDDTQLIQSTVIPLLIDLRKEFFTIELYVTNEVLLYPKFVVNIEKALRINLECYYFLPAILRPNIKKLCIVGHNGIVENSLNNYLDEIRSATMLYRIIRENSTKDFRVDYK
ncbi:hypothetical protein GCM10008018_69590 [Paenibacillus marchantiophytorum]|uniref:Uncharacterized protein n=1 Tax=Paenibacillus marchantiophytorum TaxID=1619310 RepID=A0ABQ1FI68_9BACL|nr:hypothetical protein GCM10008018_69590 [Paenibacillus marchantiophytorum]